MENYYAVGAAGYCKSIDDRAGYFVKMDGNIVRFTVTVIVPALNDSISRAADRLQGYIVVPWKACTIQDNILIIGPFIDKYRCSGERVF